MVRDGAFHRGEGEESAICVPLVAREGGAEHAEYCGTRAERPEAAEFLAYFPELRPQVQVVEEGLKAVCEELEKANDAIRGIPSQKDFAAEALKTRCSSALFAVRAGKAASIRDFLLAAPSVLVIRLLNLKDEATAGGVGEGSLRLLI